MKHFFPVLFMLIACGSVAQAQESREPAKVRAAVLDCVSRMDVSTTWDQCRRLMFLTCEKEKVGSAPHIACLGEERTYWTGERERLFENVRPKLTSHGSVSLFDLFGQWINYVGRKCGDVAKAKADISADAAKLGCEISENVGLVAELTACLDDRSTAPYCQFKE